jgi:hypothetical protein
MIVRERQQTPAGPFRTLVTRADADFHVQLGLHRRRNIVSGLAEHEHSAHAGFRMLGQLRARLAGPSGHPVDLPLLRGERLSPPLAFVAEPDEPGDGVVEEPEDSRRVGGVA